MSTIIDLDENHKAKVVESVHAVRLATNDHELVNWCIEQGVLSSRSRFVNGICIHRHWVEIQINLSKFTPELEKIELLFKRLEHLGINAIILFDDLEPTITY